FNQFFHLSPLLKFVSHLLCVQTQCYSFFILSEFLVFFLMEKVNSNHLQQHHLALPKISSQKKPCNQTQWIFHNFPSDITIEVCGVAFALHKFPLVSKSGRIRKLVAEQRDSDASKMELINLPGGSESFELAAKFCYGIKFEMTPANIAQICCVSDYLDMQEELSDDNLGSRAEHYIDTVICSNLKMCVEVLRKCESLLPLADELRIVSRCIDSIASKACVEQIASSFSRLEYSNSGRLHMGKGLKCQADWWIKDLSYLRIDLYKRVLEAMKCRGVRPESIGASLVSYAHSQSRANAVVVETIVSLLPMERLMVPVSFLFVLLQSSIVLDCSDSCRLNLERRIGSQMDMATIDDLLILSDTAFDVDTVHRILVNFSQQDDSEDDESMSETESLHSPSQMALYKVSKLVDTYLAQIAPNEHLKLSKFLVIAESLPAHARTIHDGLYRAIDIYLKAHEGLPEAEKIRLCKLIDFQKLSQEAGEHAAQNERLPLQSAVQVLYVEQLRLRDALFCSYPEEEPKPMFQSWRVNGKAVSASMSPKDNYASLRRENRELKLELARLRMRLNDLEKDHVSMKMKMEKTGSCKFMCSLTKKISFFRQSSSWGLSSSSKLSHRIDSKVTDRTLLNYHT
ncbi:hypothetical protein V2J09_005133, partial [Rumex salicifolius]